MVILYFNLQANFRTPIAVSDDSGEMSSVPRIFSNAQNVTAFVNVLRRSSSIAPSLIVLVVLSLNFYVPGFNHLAAIKS